MRMIDHTGILLTIMLQLILFVLFGLDVLQVQLIEQTPRTNPNTPEYHRDLD